LLEVTARAAILLIFLCYTSAAFSANGEKGVAVISKSLGVELTPSPEELAFSFYSLAGEPVDVFGIQARVIIAAGEPAGARTEAIVSRPAGEIRPNRLACPVELKSVKSFYATLLFNYGGEPYVIRFPLLSPYPPYIQEGLPHDVLPHGHVNPHDGFVEAIGNNHSELAVENRVLRLFWYDVAMNQIPAAGIRAHCFLEPCEGGTGSVELLPVGRDPALPHYLEAGVPDACGSAVKIALRLEIGAATRTYRYRLSWPVKDLVSLGSVRLGSSRVGDNLVELRSPPGETGFPQKETLELRFLNAETLAPIDFREAPGLSLRLGEGRTIALQSPLRLAYPGLWRIAAYLPPWGAPLLDVRFRTPAGEASETSFALAKSGERLRTPNPVWLGALLAAGGLLVTLFFMRSRQRARSGGADLAELLGLKPLLASRIVPAVIQWPLFPVFLFAIYRLFSGPAQSLLNPAVLLLLGFLLPAVHLSPMLLARSWCSICPFTVPIDLARDLLGASKKVPAWLSRRKAFLIALQLIAVSVLSLVSGLLLHSRAIGIVLTFYFLLGVGMALFYEGRAFCRAVCPVGSVLELFSSAGPYRCLKGSPHDALAIDLRMPFEDLSRESASEPKTYGTVPFAVLGCSFLILLSMHPGWFWIGPWLGSPAPAAGIVWAALVLTFFALVPLALGALASRASGRLGAGSGTALSESGIPGASAIPLAYASVALWALAALIGSGAVLPTLARAIMSGERIEQAASGPLDPTVLLSLQIGILVTGAALSVLLAFRMAGTSSDCRRNRLLAVFPHALVIAFLAAVLLLLAATSFDLHIPLRLVSAQAILP
jgi:hypothetical protein